MIHSADRSLFTEQLFFQELGAVYDNQYSNSQEL